MALGWIEDFAAGLALSPALLEFFGLVDLKKFLAELKKAVEDLTRGVRGWLTQTLRFYYCYS